jgi:hypothetical protein
MTDASMTHVTHSANVTAPETPAQVRDHRESFHWFMKFAIFAVLHVALVLACLALGFPGHAPTFALLLGVGGTLALIVAFMITE